MSSDLPPAAMPPESPAAVRLRARSLPLPTATHVAAAWRERGVAPGPCAFAARSWRQPLSSAPPLTAPPTAGAVQLVPNEFFLQNFRRGTTNWLPTFPSATPSESTLAIGHASLTSREHNSGIGARNWRSSPPPRARSALWVRTSGACSAFLAMKRLSC